MATIQARRRRDGSIGYTATIRIKHGGKIVHIESMTLSVRRQVVEWAKRRELELEAPGALERAKFGGTSLGKVIARYIEEFQPISKWQRSKSADLKRLQGCSIAETDVTKLTVQMLIDHVRLRRSKGVSAATALNDLVWIGVVLRTAKTAFGLPVDPEIVTQARDTCYDLKLVAKSRMRDRRPTPEELKRLEEHFCRKKKAKIPMVDIMWFAIHSSRREAEICRIEWADNDEATLTGLLRDAKHPRHKEGNHRRFKYTRDAWDIVQRQPRTSEYIFPYNPKSISHAFTLACKILGIEDLDFHDLRHEATSRLFEKGYQIHEVAMFTLHESWQTLKRYTQVRPETIREL